MATLKHVGTDAFVRPAKRSERKLASLAVFKFYAFVGNPKRMRPDPAI